VYTSGNLRICKLLVPALAGLCLAAFAHSRPVTIENGYTLLAPSPRPYPLDFWFTGQGAIDGDWLLVGAVSGERPDRTHQVALLYRRNGAAWIFDRMLDDSLFSESTTSEPIVHMQDGVAAIANGFDLKVYERSGTQWTRVPVNEPRSGIPIALDGRRILSSACEWDGNVYERTASAWVVTGRLDVTPAVCTPPSDFGLGTPRAIGGTLAAIDNWYTEEHPQWAVHLYRLAAGAWTREAVLTHPDSGEHYFHSPAIHGDEVLIATNRHDGTLVFGTGAGGWRQTGRILATDSFDSGGEIGQSQVSGDLVMLSQLSPDQQRATPRIFRRVAPGRYEYVAHIPDRNGLLHYGTWGSAIDGRYVLTRRTTQTDGNVMTVFELPQDFTTAPTLQDDFETGNAAVWTPLPGSQWRVTAAGATNVYNQFNTAGDAGAVLSGSDRTDQAIQADIQARSFVGADRWFGLVTRYSDAANHYYVTLRSSNRVELRRMLNGAFTTLASAPLTVTIGQTFRVNLESVGSAHRVYVDGRQLLVAYDDTHTHGQAGMKMYRTDAVYDNVVVTAGPRTTIRSRASSWQSFDREGGTWQNNTIRPNSISQVLTTGDARLLAGSPETTDQVVQARLWLDACGPASGGQCWYGLFARYVDARNHYYVTLRSSNQLQIRKMVNGVITVLASTPFTVNATPRRLRFDAVGDRLRVFVDGTPALEARDASIPAGQIGIGGYRAAATYAELTSYQP
jgi:hypothetical protein